MQTVTVANVMCGGCANTIETSLSEMDGVDYVKVNVEDKTVTLGLDEGVMQSVTEKLAELGYPVQ
ncbi:MAG: heavy-metal-associated domain-containing protein [Gammaproteobacteria bacterium]|uniref:Heavy-metal-associated domain-containing protein n=1 Tax=Candidatus Thiopontia autotrophica TaxID=2841688 RepID=A0A8J6P475_9GAMM|nr:heavy-metal-associated domain-containing protein [Candidatus Thiopontia autotrophica]MBL6969072.1 heavy-metal-associated domain-containing protein [Gammaproteobacteria bacterium]